MIWNEKKLIGKLEKLKGLNGIHRARAGDEAEYKFYDGKVQGLDHAIKLLKGEL